MSSRCVRRAGLRWALPSALLVWPALLEAGPGRLGGDNAVDISFGRILAALVVCIIIAILAALLIRQKGGKLDLKTLFGRVDFRARAIEIVETRRLSQHADISLIRYDGREYLLLLEAGNAQILSERPLTASSEEGAVA